MVVERDYALVLQHTVHLFKIFFWLIEFMENIIDKNDIQAFIGKARISVRKDRLDVLQPLTFCAVLDLLDSLGMNIQRIDTACVADEPGRGQGITSRAAAEIEHSVARFDAGFSQHF